jgi:hypothetical protein
MTLPDRSSANKAIVPFRGIARTRLKTLARQHRQQSRHKRPLLSRLKLGLPPARKTAPEDNR